MPIIFEDRGRRRRKGRWAAGSLAVAAASFGLLLGFTYNIGVDTKAPTDPDRRAPAVLSTGNTLIPGKVVGEPATEARAMRACSVVDGDTLRCDGERIRLLGIDAPELPGHCRPGRNCVEGDPLAATTALSTAIGNSGVRISAAGTDFYGRTLANVYVGEDNVACGLIRGGFVQYVAKWDNGGLLAKDCPELVN